MLPHTQGPGGSTIHLNLEPPPPHVAHLTAHHSHRAAAARRATTATCWSACPRSTPSSGATPRARSTRTRRRCVRLCACASLAAHSPSHRVPRGWVHGPAGGRVPRVWRTYTDISGASRVCGPLLTALGEGRRCDAVSTAPPHPLTPPPPTRHPQGFVRSTTKYWVRNEDVSTVKHHVLQHLPVFQFDKVGGGGPLVAAH
jgi:hypothetical protein